MHAGISGSLKERDHFADVGVDGNKKLKWILKNRCCVDDTH